MNEAIMVWFEPNSSLPFTVAYFKNLERARMYCVKHNLNRDFSWEYDNEDSWRRAPQMISDLKRTGAYYNNPFAQTQILDRDT